jgi:hypothetical protein
MSHHDVPAPRRRFLVSGLSVLGCVLSLGLLAAISGCGEDKSGGQVDNPGDVAKTPDAQDSMKAAMEQMKKRGNPAAKQK